MEPAAGNEAREPRMPVRSDLPRGYLLGTKLGGSKYAIMNVSSQGR
jgi:hypothetical protein